MVGIRKVGCGFVAVLAIMTTACGGAAPVVAESVKSPFPTQQEIVAMTSLAVPAHSKPALRSSAAWDFEETSGVFPSSALEAVWNKRASGTKFRGELHCVAAEFARYVSVNEAEPDDRLRRWIAGVCKVNTINVRMSSATPFNVPANVSDAQVVEAMIQPDQMLPSVLDRKGELGLAIVRVGTRVVAAMAQSKTVVPTSFSEVDAKNTVTVTADLSDQNVGAIVFINQGAYDVVPCPLSSKPRAGTGFTWSCPMAKADASTWIEVAEIRPGQFLSVTVAQALVRRDPFKKVHYTIAMPGGTGAASVTGPQTEATIAKSIFEGINRSRAEAHLPQVAFAEAQSLGDNARIAPHFFHALETQNTERMNQTLLGLMAGWNVNGTIRDALACGSFVAAATTSSEWLAGMLDWPSGRLCLFTKDVQQLAVGVTTVQTLGGQGVVVSAYKMYEGYDHANDARAFIDRLNAKRAQKGLPNVVWIKASDALHKAALQSSANESSPTDALHEALNHETEERQTRVLGLWTGALRIEDTKLDPLLIDTPALRVMIEVTHTKGTTLPWGNLMVFVMAIPSE
jgi:hypothetical protein